MLKIGYIKYSLTTNFGYKVYRGFLNLVFLHEFQCNFWYIERFISGISVFWYIYIKWCTEAMLILSYFQLILMTGLTTITLNGQTWKNYSRQHATNCTKSESLLHECSEMTLLLSFQLGSSLFYCLFSTPALIFSSVLHFILFVVLLKSCLMARWTLCWSLCLLHHLSFTPYFSVPCVVNLF